MSALRPEAAAQQRPVGARSGPFLLERGTSSHIQTECDGVDADGSEDVDYGLSATMALSTDITSASGAIR